MGSCRCRPTGVVASSVRSSAWSRGGTAVVLASWEGVSLQGRWAGRSARRAALPLPVALQAVDVQAEGGGAEGAALLQGAQGYELFLGGGQRARSSLGGSYEASFIPP